ncbi:MAG TPA: cupin-like domain-containing protein [Croceibacterium sp.]|nr:cupin-like domain-containing protein [Croceibacterium sp.]
MTREAPAPVREISAEGWRDAAARESCEPFVVRGLCREWPCVGGTGRPLEWWTHYLSGADSGRPAQCFVAAPETEGRYFYGDNLAGFNFARETMPLSAAIERIGRCADDPAQGTFYVGSVPVADHLAGFARDNAVEGLPDGVEPRIWLGNRSHVSCHFDTFDNLACVVAGRRRFTLYPPALIADLYVGPIDHTMAGQPVSLAASSRPGDPRYPRFDAVRGRALQAELAPGDALYLPKLWWHEVEATGAFNVLVNYWWDAFRQGPDAPFTAMMLALLAIAERPGAERAAWRAFFDHYVFRPEGHPLRHLPESQHGILGTLDRDTRARLRAMVMKQLRG